MPSPCTPGIHLKKGEAKESKNMTGASRGGEHGGGSPWNCKNYREAMSWKTQARLLRAPHPSIGLPEGPDAAVPSPPLEPEF